jgi:hypothetical protein
MSSLRAYPQIQSRRKKKSAKAETASLVETAHASSLALLDFQNSSAKAKLSYTVEQF